MAAQTLVDGGARVLMLDGGRRDRPGTAPDPDKSFVELRRGDAEQYRYLLGDDLESAGYRRLSAGAQLTPPRQFVVAEVERFLQVRSTNFATIESLALGGLGSAWGLNCGVFSDAELELASLPASAMGDAYQTVADRIGISGLADDAQPYTIAHLERVQPPVPLDPTAAVVAASYERKRASMQAAGYRLGRPALALLTKDTNERRATSLRDMDFYDNAGDSAWRPALTMAELERRPNFAYSGGLVVTRFVETEDGVDVAATDMQTLGERRFACKRLVLAPGVLGTARIVMRSRSGAAAKLPLLCNAYTYVPSIVPSRVGRTMPERNTGLVQLLLCHDAGGDGQDVAIGTLFSYRALLLFRLLREVPLATRDARVLMNYLLSGLLIVGIDHPQSYSHGKSLRLVPDAASPSGDALAIEYYLTELENARYDARERDYLRALRRLGAWPIKRVRPPLGSSIHYAGTLPFSDEERPYTLDRTGRLHGTRSVYVADGSGFTYLPAKGLTLSLMANAHRVAKLLS
jgi:choline dehydrogenase-like flavoprotein